MLNKLVNFFQSFGWFLFQFLPLKGYQYPLVALCPIHYLLNLKKYIGKNYKIIFNFKKIELKPSCFLLFKLSCLSSFLRSSSLSASSYESLTNSFVLSDSLIIFASCLTPVVFLLFSSWSPVLSVFLKVLLLVISFNLIFLKRLISLKSAFIFLNQLLNRY